MLAWRGEEKRSVQRIVIKYLANEPSILVEEGPRLGSGVAWIEGTRYDLSGRSGSWISDMGVEHAFPWGYGRGIQNGESPIDYSESTAMGPSIKASLWK
jgi:hypothetical protein